MQVGQPQGYDNTCLIDTAHRQGLLFETSTIPITIAMLTMPGLRQQGGSLAQAVARRTVRMHLKKIREREYSKLRSLVPSVSARKKATKVQVVEGAVRYIEELHKALLERCKQTYGNEAEHKAQETVQTFVQRMMEHQKSISSAPSCQPHRLTGTTPHSVRQPCREGIRTTPLSVRNAPMHMETTPLAIRNAHAGVVNPHPAHRHANREAVTTSLPVRDTPSSFERQQRLPSFLTRKGRVL